MLKNIPKMWRNMKIFEIFTYKKLCKFPYIVSKTSLWLDYINIGYSSRIKVAQFQQRIGRANVKVYVYSSVFDRNFVKSNTRKYAKLRQIMPNYAESTRN